MAEDSRSEIELIRWPGRDFHGLFFASVQVTSTERFIPFLVSESFANSFLHRGLSLLLPGAFGLAELTEASVGVEQPLGIGGVLTDRDWENVASELTTTGQTSNGPVFD
ncbi:unnamed protein product [Protopolystoma xenopodis]|uniref:Uncharacterized protein n=1 Tax=Protopolystoma xenopodis TaxID=117903 RepID=A0A448WA28_9PLAT|nr:unnamed protein product [Protopolystoma xenopodis]